MLETQLNQQPPHIVEMTFVFIYRFPSANSRCRPPPITPMPLADTLDQIPNGRFVSVIGVSGDSVKSHVKFVDKFDLPFPLIADTDKAIMTAYGVWGEKKLYGRLYMGTKRTTFLIKEDGTIQKIIKKPNTADHAAEVLAEFSD